jgi:hypothetical protein
MQVINNPLFKEHETTAKLEVMYGILKNKKPKIVGV